MNQNSDENEIRRNLKAAGFKEELIDEFVACYKHSEKECEIKLLNHQRNQLLDEIHERQLCIDCLDYLLYQFRKETK